MSRGNDIVVAIDGPSASGKSTVAREAARRLGFVYVDSGMYYRAMTWKALREGVAPTDAPAVEALMLRCRWETDLVDGAVRLRLDGMCPSSDLRSAAVRENVSEVAAQPAVRRFIVARLRETLAYGPLVMEGRDIGSVVFPNAPFKFYLDADPNERARRRAHDIAHLEGRADEREVLESLERRDQRDRTRREAPLQIALGAVVIDTTRMSVDEVADEIVRRVRAGTA